MRSSNHTSSIVHERIHDPTYDNKPTIDTANDIFMYSQYMIALYTHISIVQDRRQFALEKYPSRTQLFGI